MYIVIRIRGTVGLKSDIKDTLTMLRLNKKMHCVILNDNESMRGMLQKVKDYVTWGEVNDDALKLLLEKRGRKVGEQKISAEEVQHLLKEIKSGKKLNDLGLKPVFRLTPPSGGFKESIKQHFPKGELGYRENKINDLIKKMM